MRSLQDVRLDELMPRAMANTSHAKGLAAAMAVIQKYVIQAVTATQFYTGIEELPEAALDALAVSMNVGWYDFSYPVETKRRILQTATSVRRYAGTPYAVRQQLAGVFGDAMLEEWMQWGGEPGTYRVSVNITDVDTNVMELEELEKIIRPVARASAQLESLSYMIRKRLHIGFSVSARQANLPLCGALRCGTWPNQSTVGRSLQQRIAVHPDHDVFATDRMLCGKLKSGTHPYSATLDLSTKKQVRAERRLELFNAETRVCGTLPELATIGILQNALLETRLEPEGFANRQPDCGQMPQAATAGERVTKAVDIKGKAQADTVEQKECGTQRTAGTVGQSKEKAVYQVADVEAYIIRKRRTGVLRCGQK